MTDQCETISSNRRGIVNKFSPPLEKQREERPMRIKTQLNSWQVYGSRHLFFSSETFSSAKQQGYFMYEPQFYNAVKNLSDFRLRLIP